MAVTLYRQLGKANPGAIRRSISVVGAAQLISPDPTSCGTCSLTVPVRGSDVRKTPQRRVISLAARRKIAAAQRARWVKQRAA